MFSFKFDFIKDFIGLTDEKMNLLVKFKDILIEINKNVNLVSRKDIDFLFEHHILHSLLVTKLFKFNTKDEFIDVGTGGGFPGIPLAIYFDKNKFTLLDSINKKISAVNSIIERLGIKNVQTECGRAENINKKYDVVLGRGVSDINIFFDLTHHLLKNNGRIIYLNGVGNTLQQKNCLKVNYYYLKDLVDIGFYKEKQIIEISVW